MNWTRAVELLEKVSRTSRAGTLAGDRPSIAVLPFANLGADPDQRYFSDGITEDIITELSRFRELLVIGRGFQLRMSRLSPTTPAGSGKS